MTSPSTPPPPRGGPPKAVWIGLVTALVGAAVAGAFVLGRKSAKTGTSGPTASAGGTTGTPGAANSTVVQALPPAPTEPVKLEVPQDRVFPAFWLDVYAPAKVRTAYFMKAMAEGLGAAMAEDDTVVVLGEDVDRSIIGGTRGLIEAIAADAGVEIRTNARVTAVTQDDAGATVTLGDGVTLTASAVVVTLPLDVLDSVSFDPPLSEGKRRAAHQGQASQGVKVWARLRGEYEPFVALAPGSAPLTLCQVEYVEDGETLVVAFGSVTGRLDGNDPGAVQEALRQWLPDVEVLAVASHDWVADDLSGETWPMQRAGQLTGALAELQRPEGRVLLAGSDYADGWAGFIDGAIESGMRAGRDVHALLTSVDTIPVADALPRS